MTEEFDPYREWEAAYTLGMLSPGDRRAYEHHLTTCESCSAGVAALAGLPGILALLAPHEASEIDRAAAEEPVDAAQPVANVLPHLTHRINTRRRRIRVRASLAASVAVLALGLAIGGYQLGSATNSSPQAASPSTEAPAGHFLYDAPMTPTGKEPLTAVLQVESKPWGTRLDWECDYSQTQWVNGPPTYELVVTQRSGTETVVARWSAAGDHAAGLAAATDIPSAELDSVEIRQIGDSAPIATTKL